MLTILLCQIVFVAFQCLGTIEGNESKAVLNLSTEHKLSSDPPKVGDTIRYSCNLSHISTSKLEAVNITIFVIIPSLIKFDKSFSDSLNIEVLSNGNIKFQFDKCDPKDSVAFEFQATFLKEVSAGQHHLVAAFEVNYQSILIDQTVTDKFARVMTYDHVSITGSDCMEPLGIGNKYIEDYQLTASTSAGLKPTLARYGDSDSDAWCALGEDLNPYIQIAFAYKARVTAISTWGRVRKNAFVKGYRLSYSNDEEQWTYYSENGMPKEFSANVDQNTEQQNFINGLTANFVRIHPIKWHILACLRMELYGCYIGENRNCFDPIGMENGKIPTSSLDQNSSSALANVEYARLNHNVVNYPYGWIAGSLPDEWLQINLNSLHKITMVAIMGGTKAQFYVKDFYLRYSNNSLDWHTLQENGKEKLLALPQAYNDATEPCLIPIVPSLIARMFRFIPDNFNNFKVMRVELYGCMVEDDYVHKDHLKQLSRRSVLVDEQRNKLYICSLTSERRKSSCKRSNDGYAWKALSPSVNALISMQEETGRIFGIDRNYEIIMSDNYGDMWYSISREEWAHQARTYSMKNMTLLEDIVGNTEPEAGMSWTLNNGTTWGVSGLGWHKQSSPDSWTLSALWSCCGE